MLIVKVITQLISLAAISTAVFLGYQTLGTDKTIETYYESGALKSIVELDHSGKKHGRFLEFYEDGTPKQESEFSHDVWIQIIHYYPNGLKEHEANSNGFNRHWNEDGTEIECR